MKRRVINSLQYIFFLGLGIFLVWWSLKGMKPEETKQFKDSLSHANYWILIPVVIMSMLSHISRAMRWRLLINTLGYQPSLKNTFLTVLIGYFANTIFRLGEILKCTLLGKYEKIPSGQLIGTILLERTFDMLCYIIVILVTLLAQANVIGEFVKKTFKEIFSNSTGSFSWMKLFLIIGGLTIILLTIRFVLKRFAHINLVAKIKSFLNGFIAGLISIRKMKNYKVFLAHTIFIWVMYLGQIYVAFYAIQQTAHLGAGASLSVLTLATLAMIVTPNGIGAFPIAVQKILMLYGIHEAIGISFGWLMWGTTTSIIFVGGLISLLIIPYINKRKHERH